MQKNQRALRSGFTIVELLVVIVVIAILAAITVVSYNGITNQARQTTLIADLRNNGAILEMAHIKTGAYPVGTTPPAELKTSPGVSLQYSSDGNEFCITASSQHKGVPSHTISSSVNQPQRGICDTHTDPQVPPTNAGQTWESVTLPSSTGGNSITFGNGRFVSIGSGSILTSTDGLTWQRIALPVENVWMDVTYGNGLFVAVGRDGNYSEDNIRLVMTSPDGINWTARNAAAGDWASITFGNGRFVATAVLSYGYFFMTSTDGINWTPLPITSMTSGQWPIVTFRQGRFLAIESGYRENKVVTSTDGINWQLNAAKAPMSSLTGIAYGNGRYIVLNIMGSLITSTDDGATWAAMPPLQISGARDIIYADGRFVVITAAGDNRVVSSTDGETWTYHNAASQRSWVSITHGNGCFVAVANGTSSVNNVMRSCR